MEVLFEPLKAKWKEKDGTWTFHNGAILRLTYLDCFSDALKHRGNQFTWRGHDELTMRPTDEEYVFLDSRMRSANGVPCKTISTTNPGGPGHTWVMKRFKIDIYPNGMTPIHEYYDLEKNIRMEAHEVPPEWNKAEKADLPKHIRRKTRIFIPSKLQDNAFLDSDGMYRGNLLSLPEAQRRMMLDGRWDIVEGAFFDEWDPNVHTIRAFTPPPDWKRWMAGDWGTTKPYAFVWFTEAPNGEVYVYRELYGCKEGKDNEGLRESPATVAEKILQVEQEADEWIGERYLDASCFDNYEMGTSVAEQFRLNGVTFQRSQKKFKSGSIAMFRDYLKVINGTSRFKVMTNCHHLMRHIPLVQIDKSNVEQYDSDGADHDLDAVLYGIRRNIRTKEEINEARGIGNYNRRLLAKYGVYGAH
jgi:hypothetical protein